ncbi:MAG: hypothetical protein LBK02_04335 [Treponema sp.]|jgi:hypothetical protein|nr:hypothetical protein [Treponema sp.]
MGNENITVLMPEQGPVAPDFQPEISRLACYRPYVALRGFFSKPGEGGFNAALIGFV